MHASPTELSCRFAAGVAAARTLVARRLCALAILLFLAVPAVAGAQGQLFYVYDDLNRLSAVVTQQGDVAVYTYDAVGNIVKIDRFDASSAPGAVGISYFTPGAGKSGTVVQVFGKGFSATPGQNSLAFHGTPATVTSAAPNRLIVSVPAGATTGPISVTTPLGSATSATPFRISGSTLTVSPAVEEVQVGLTQQFTASEDNTPTTNVRWTLDGLAATIGRISESGLYTAPAAVPFPATVTITATDKDDSSVTGTARITLLTVSPRYALSRAVSVAVTAPLQDVTKSLAAGVSVAIQPVVTSILPAAATAGTTVSVTLQGAGLAGATSLTFLRNNASDTTITAANITPSSDGTSLTADITVAAGTPLGGRVVQVTVSGHTSMPAPIAGNVFTVQ